jgi:hypothetical protein
LEEEWLMFLYATLTSAAPFPNTLEGLVFLDDKYVQRDVFVTIQFEVLGSVEIL